MLSFFKQLFSSSDQKKKSDLLVAGLQKTKKSFLQRLGAIFVAGASQEDYMEELEELLITADIGASTTAKLIQELHKDPPANLDQALQALRLHMQSLLPERDFLPIERAQPYVVLVVGINGVGKTTSIAKLAHFYQAANKKVLLAAGDTFRAAAAEQLTIWAERLGVPIVKQQHGADPASVAFDALQSAKAKQMDVVIIDTAGRLSSNVSLMKELERIKRVIQKFDAQAPHEVVLVLDANTGQNAIAQAQEFGKATQVSSIFLTKLDSSARGGVVFGIADQLRIPIAYLGIGERAEDMMLFDKDLFIEQFFSDQVQQQ